MLAPRILARREMAIVRESDVVDVRRAVRDIARERGFDAFATAALTTATSELTRNALIHGGGGSATIEEIEQGGRAGVRIEFTDHGPGIPHLERALKGGFSTRRSLGLGLSGSHRLVDDFQIETSADKGTQITIVKWARFAR